VRTFIGYLQISAFAFLSEALDPEQTSMFTDMGETPRSIFVTSGAQRAKLQYGHRISIYIVHKNKSRRPTGICVNIATSKNFLIGDRADWTCRPQRR
jgi:hypothetical protein